MLHESYHLVAFYQLASWVIWPCLSHSFFWGHPSHG